MQRWLSLPPAAGLLTVALVFGLVRDAVATPRGRSGRTNGTLTAHRAHVPEQPAPPPLPPVALQLTGLRVLIPVPRSAIVHALVRDAWPGLVRCVTPPPATRGFSTVEVREAEQGGLEVSLHGGPPARDQRLGACIRHAVARLVLPPYEQEFDSSPRATRVEFSLAFGVPPLGVSRSRGR